MLRLKLHDLAAGVLLLALSFQVSARDLALDLVGDMLFSANHDAQSISKVDLGSLDKIAEFKLNLPPDNLALDAEGRIWVTSRLTDRVGVYDSGSGSELALIHTGDQPFDVLHLGGSHTAVSLYGADQVLLINRSTLGVDESVAVPPAPRGLALSPDGQKLLVTHFRSGILSIIDIASWQVETTIQAEVDGNLSQNLAVTLDGTRAYLPLTRSNTSNQALLFDTTVFPIVSVIDLVNNVSAPGERISLDIVDEPVGIPLDAALTDDHLFILNAGSNDLTVINRATRLGVAHLELGHNPRSMLLSPDKSWLYVHNSLSGMVSVVDTRTLTVTEEVVVSTNPLPPGILNGKRLFNSSDRTDLARDQWIACATCHFDGEMDGRTWFFPDGPRNTTSLLGVAETLPVHWSGDLDELHDVENTVRTIQAGTGLADGPDNCSPACDQAPPNAGRSQDLDDLAAYMSTLTLRANPNLTPSGDFSAAAIRGQKLFHSEETQCATCHVPPLYTDRLRHDVGTGGHPDERKGPDFDTPSLRGIFATAPYLHDGRAATLEDVLTTHNADDLHGSSSGLSSEDISDLLAFLASLTYPIPIFANGFE